MNSGIYMILCLATNKFYIGRAFNLDARWRTHKCALTKQRHTNEYLQNAWNKYGEENFKFYILEYVGKSEIINREQHWIDKTGCLNLGFNINPSAKNSLGYKHSEEAKLKIKNNTLRLGLKPPSPIGRVHSQETKLKMSLSAKGKPKSEKAKANMRKPKTDEHKENLRKSRINFKHTAESKEKISQSLIGNKRALRI